MENLDTPFENDIDIAVARAKLDGRFDIADYLSLKASNDRLRKEAVKWLTETILEIVHAFNRHGARIDVEEDPSHKFKNGSSRLSGTRLDLRKGLRCMTIEAGWTRLPGDGVMRGGSLAFSRISHFGVTKETEELELHKLEGKPQWFGIRGEKLRESFNISSLKRHFEVFMG